MFICKITAFNTESRSLQYGAQSHQVSIPPYLHIAQKIGHTRSIFAMPIFSASSFNSSSSRNDSTFC